MKKKYYYDCLIKALYMNKEFGVDFFIKDDDGDDYDFTEWYLNSQNVLELFTELEAFPCRIYVKSESEHIFELKEGDLCKNIEDDDMGELCMIQGHGLAIPVANGGEGGWMVVDKSEVEILKRDNKQFFNPKEEN